MTGPGPSPSSGPSRGLASGRFAAAPDPFFKRFNDSLSFDARLIHADIRGSVAWAGALHAAGILSAPELADLTRALSDLDAEAARDPSIVTSSGEEDVHSFVESRLTARLGPLGKKLHTGRSRNDQVATDLRLWTREALSLRLAEVRSLQRSLIDLARRDGDALFPGYTHLQRAQPVLFAHWCLAYVEMLSRDGLRFRDARTRANVCPLGCGALAGTAYPIDRAALASSLGFDAPTANSIDSVSDRDFVFESLAAFALCGSHLSRLAEDLILYSTGEFAMVELHESVSTGSSLMPQKKNPDSMELVRAKSARLLGNLVSLAACLKGLPTAYNKDLQEDKEPLFDSSDSLSACLRVSATVISTLTLRHDAAAAHAHAGHSNATDLADYLVSRSIPFREAHDIAGRAVRLALSRRVTLEQLPLADLQSLSPAIVGDVFDRIRTQAAMARRSSLGGTAPDAVRLALEHADARLRSDAAADPVPS